MSDFLTLHAKKRTQTGKGIARRLRATGFVPAVFYDAKGASTPIQISEKELDKTYKTIGRTAVFNIEIDNDGTPSVFPALFWDVDFYPTQNRIQHVDIFGVDLDKEIKIRVPLVLTGVAKGVKVGGKLEVYREFIDICSKPLSLPSKIELDITDMGINSAKFIEDVILPEGVRVEYSNNFAIVRVNLGRGADAAGEE